MGGIWPEPTAVEKAEGWKISPGFLAVVRSRAIEIGGEFGNVSTEAVEAVLIAGSMVERNIDTTPNK